MQVPLSASLDTDGSWGKLVSAGQLLEFPLSA